MDKVAVITGASHGLGLETAKKCIDKGWKVVGTGLSERPSDLPDEVEYYKFDASDADACVHFWQEVQGQHADRKLLLVNNAGGYVGGGLKETSFEDIHKMLHVNYLAAVNMTRAMVDVYEAARVITIVSSAAHVPIANNAAYGASKAAEKYFFQALQEELDHKKFQFTNIYPKVIATQGPNPHAIQPEDLAGFICELGAMGTSFYMRDVTLYPAQ